MNRASARVKTTLWPARTAALPRHCASIVLSISARCPARQHVIQWRSGRGGRSDTPAVRAHAAADWHYSEARVGGHVRGLASTGHRTAHTNRGHRSRCSARNSNPVPLVNSLFRCAARSGSVFAEECLGPRRYRRGGFDLPRPATKAAQRLWSWYPAWRPTPRCRADLYEQTGCGRASRQPTEATSGTC